MDFLPFSRSTGANRPVLHGRSRVPGCPIAGARAAPPRVIRLLLVPRYTWNASGNDDKVLPNDHRWQGLKKSFWAAQATTKDKESSMTDQTGPHLKRTAQLDEHDLPHVTWHEGEPSQAPVPIISTDAQPCSGIDRAGQDTPSTPTDWTRSMVKFRQPIPSRSIFELVVALTPFVAIWVVAWWMVSISSLLALALALANSAFRLRLSLSSMIAGTARCCVTGVCATGSDGASACSR